MRWPTKVQTVSRSRLIGEVPPITYGTELVVNNTLSGADWGDDWDETAGCDLSKSFILVGPDGDASSFLEVVKDTSASPWGGYQEILTVGERYIIAGWARSNNGNEEPRVFDTGVTVWTGTTSTSWQLMYGEFVATTTRVQFGGTGGAAADGADFYKPSIKQVSPNIVAIYDMKPAGNVVPDEWYSGNDATIHGPTQGSTQLGSAMSFDGVDDYLDLTGMVSTVGTYTFNMWIRCDTADTTDQYIMDVETGRFILAFFTSAPGQIGFYDGAWRSIGDAPNDGLWHHLVWLFDGVNSEGSLYIDALSYGVTQTYTAKNIGGAVAIGSRYTANTAFLNFDMAQFEIYTELKSTDWITEEYEKGQLAVWHTDW